MNVKKIFPFGLVILFLFSCSGKKKEPQSQEETKPVPEIAIDSFQKSFVISSVVSNKDASLSYSLYLPHQYNDNAKLPAFIFFDPHADGAFPLSKYQLLAEKFGVIMVGSNNSKNGLSFDQTNAIAQKLMEEVTEQFHANEKQISLCGFSGGAKVALIAGMTMRGISSLIYCGAGIPSQQVSTISPALGFAGPRDLNYTEVIDTDAALEEKKMSHALVEWNGKHEWPDSVAFEDAFYWIRFKTMESKTDSINHDLVNEFRNKNNKTLKNPVSEWWRLKKMISFLNGVADVSGYVSSKQSLTKGKGFAAAMARIKNDLATERKIKQSYYDNIEQRDLSWWSNEIVRLKKGRGADVVNDRLLGYISLMCYSISNSAIEQGDAQTAAKILAIYKLADPLNPDGPYLEACLYARQNNKDSALVVLHEAIRLGFKDKSKLQQDESFASLRSLREFNEMTR